MRVRRGRDLVHIIPPARTRAIAALSPAGDTVVNAMPMDARVATAQLSPLTICFNPARLRTRTYAIAVLCTFWGWQNALPADTC